jgi:hypothetical protein
MNQPNWQAVLVDCVTLLVVGALMYAKVLSPEIGTPILVMVVSARAALARPPGGGPGGPSAGVSSSAVVAVALGLLAPILTARMKGDA